MDALKALRALVRLTLAEDAAREPYVVDVTDDVVEAAFDEVTDFRTLAGVRTFVAFEQRKAFPSHSPIAKVAKVHGFKPADVGAFLKKGIDVPKGGKTRFVGDERTRSRFLGAMADRIARRFKGVAIDEVMPIDSTYGMSVELGAMVAERLGVPFRRKVEKEDNAEKIAVDDDALSHWVANVAPRSAEAAGVPYDDYVLRTLYDLDRDGKTFKSAVGRKTVASIARHLPHARRKFWNLFKRVEAEGSKRVLVIDDNVASGATNAHVAKRMRAAGIEPLFAVGYYYAS